MQLDMENTALSQAAQRSHGDGDGTENLDVQGIADRIVRLKGKLKEANKTATQPVLFEGMFADRIVRLKG